MIEKNRQEQLAELVVNNFSKSDSNTVSELIKQFGRDTFGSHELCDRASLIMSMWEDFILNHPACILNADLYRQSSIIFDALYQFYQNSAMNDISESDLNENPTPPII